MRCSTRATWCSTSGPPPSSRRTRSSPYTQPSPACSASATRTCSLPTSSISRQCSRTARARRPQPCQAAASMSNTPVGRRIRPPRHSPPRAHGGEDARALVSVCVCSFSCHAAPPGLRQILSRLARTCAQLAVSSPIEGLRPSSSTMCMRTCLRPAQTLGPPQSRRHDSPSGVWRPIALLSRAPPATPAPRSARSLYVYVYVYASYAGCCLVSLLPCSSVHSRVVVRYVRVVSVVCAVSVLLCP
mmetsp:Transcript_36701/g.117909  ORF Transcript_36701/g.117909 Transcript_36701/m.117909 type:complete len:244 (+) Transcript_36701:2096-2827(+)